ncbi:GTPase domain-containing protein [Catenuloplanes sp. NPDC051500]|uniref:GTPase domain-containing protein n=1 Tax=Catenuloplanes sp. NPDC051500 TaxID=3363959 RepID=UPI0037AE25A9
MIYVLLFALLAAGVAIVLKRRSRRAAVPIAGDEAGVPTFRVAALGPRGSGKTLLLASMYHEMQVWGGRSFLLTAPRAEVALLNKWFSQVEDTGQDWPAGTAAADTREFTFTARARTRTGTLRPVLRLVYLEYAGKVLTEPEEPGSKLWNDLDTQVQRADALIGIIDGHRVRQWYDGEPEGRIRLQHAMTAMINRMLTVHKPVTFIITKWDLLRDIDADEDARLRAVRKLLMSNRGFRELVQEHTSRRVVRLIPVSAVGPSFAEMDDDGAVAKVPGGELRPTNVDVPLAAVVPDVFEQVARALDREKLAAVLERARRRSGVGPAAALTELGTFILAQTTRAAGAVGAFSAPYVSFLGAAAAELLTPQAEARAVRTERALSEAEQEVEDFQLAQRRVIRDLQSRVDVLEGRLPASRLDGGE